uniref:Uncharacterized protein n=1 Tax=Aegilops tauschii subsp. strangulata TaxID=200361 RepID=A0A452XPV6_AEGTS
PPPQHRKENLVVPYPKTLPRGEAPVLSALFSFPPGDGGGVLSGEMSTNGGDCAGFRLSGALVLLHSGDQITRIPRHLPLQRRLNSSLQNTGSAQGKALVHECGRENSFSSFFWSVRLDHTSITCAFLLAVDHLFQICTFFGDFYFVPSILLRRVI